ncbi:MAG: hypothetical protein M1290_01405 [Candidatus Thermoplasmatota archaeon]|jgi:hypothetical protein|nr:hypothetical protein [Candidatus Thermoplasmatota archaeon]MCL5789105.1 hypothetical protein [Candidatus Thermoplasmatota archaeon]
MFRKIASGLDMCFHISTPLNSYALRSVAREGKVPLNIFEEGDKTYFTFYITGMTKEESLLTESLNPVNLGEIIQITEALENPVLSRFGMEALKIPTIVAVERYAEKGNFVGRYRFHSSDIDGFNSALKDIVSVNYPLFDLGMHPCPPRGSALDDLNKRIPLSVIEFQYVTSEERDIEVEWKNIDQDPIKGICYTQDGKVKAFDMGKLDTFGLLKTIAKDHIALAMYAEFHEGTKARSVSLLPTVLLKPYLVRLFSNSDSIKEMKIVNIEAYDEIMKDPESPYRF